MSAGAAFLGSYERFLFKYNLQREAVPEEKARATSGDLRFVKTACHAAHTGPVKCIAAKGGCVFTGGTGDSIRLYDTKTGLEIDSLSVPDAGGVTCLALASQSISPEADLLINGCVDGAVHFWRKKKDSWVHQKRAAFHKEAVNGVDIHSTGKMAFTVSRDRGLVLWDTSTNKRAFSCKLSVEAGSVHFHTYLPEYYWLRYQNTVARVSLQDVQTFNSWKQMADVQSLCFWKRSHFLTASDDGAVRVWDERSTDPVLEISDAHQSRIKAIDTLNQHHLTTGASDGELKLWDLRKTKKSCQVTPWLSEDTGARITCLVCVSGEVDSERPLKRVRIEEE